MQAALDKTQYYQAGETLNVSGAYYTGHVTNGGNRVQFFIPLPRNITKRTVTMNKPWALSIRGTNGNNYLMPSAAANSYQYRALTSDDYGNMVTILVEKRTSGLVVTFQSATKWYSAKDKEQPNNTPVTVEIATMSFKLT